MKRGSLLLLISMALSIAYLLYSAVYWGGAGDNVGSSAEAAGAAIASALVMPHLACTLIGAIFNILGFAMRKRPFVLVAGILYAVAMILFPMYFFFVVIQTVLCFVAYARMKESV